MDSDVCKGSAPSRPNKKEQGKEIQLEKTHHEYRPSIGWALLACQDAVLLLEHRVLESQAHGDHHLSYHMLNTKSTADATNTTIQSTFRILGRIGCSLHPHSVGAKTVAGTTP